MNYQTLFKRYKSTSKTHKKTADRNWAYAKNSNDGYYFDVAKDMYRREKENLIKAKEIMDKYDIKDSYVDERLKNLS